MSISTPSYLLLGDDRQGWIELTVGGFNRGKKPLQEVK